MTVIVVSRSSLQPFLDTSPWHRYIADWQARTKEELADGLHVEGLVGGRYVLHASTRPADSESRYRHFRSLESWIRDSGDFQYIPDPGIDIWPTMNEVLAAGGDDCDGLSFLAFHALRDAGFGDEVMIAIIRKKSGKLHHMVVLWFDESNDPWILDATGAATSYKEVRWSEIENTWGVRIVFDFDNVYTMETQY